MIAIDIPYLVRGEVRRYMGEIPMPDIVSSLDYILENIFHIPKISSRYALPPYFIERLAATAYVGLDAGIALFSEYSGHKTRIGDPESVSPIFFCQILRVVLITVPRRRTDSAAVLPYYFKHCRFACPNVAP